jgi:hypothetical protein
MYIFLNLAYRSNDVNYTALQVFCRLLQIISVKDHGTVFSVEHSCILKSVNDMLLGNLLVVRLMSKLLQV